MLNSNLSYRSKIICISYFVSCKDLIIQHSIYHVIHKYCQNYCGSEIVYELVIVSEE